MTETNKSQLESKHAKYTGKMLKKEGTSKDKDGKDKAWKLWELVFDVGGAYPWRCSCFGSLSDKKPEYIQFEDLKEGVYYEVVYSTRDYTNQYGPQKGRTAVLIKASSEEQAKAQPTTGSVTTTSLSGTTHSPQAILNKFSAEEFSSFVKAYDEKMENNPNKSALHLVGAWVVNKAGDANTELINACKNHFN